MSDWDNNLLQFTRLLHALISAGALTPEKIETVAALMKCDERDVLDLVVRVKDAMVNLERRS